MIFLGLVGPGIYAHRAQTGKPAEQSRTAEMKNAAGNRENKENNATSAAPRARQGSRKKLPQLKQTLRSPSTGMALMAPGARRIVSDGSKHEVLENLPFYSPQMARLFRGTAEGVLTVEEGLEKISANGDSIPCLARRAGL